MGASKRVAELVVARLKPSFRDTLRSGAFWQRDRVGRLSDPYLPRSNPQGWASYRDPPDMVRYFMTISEQHS